MFNGSDHFTRYINNIRWDFFSRRIEDDELSNMNAILKPRGVLDVDKVYFYAKDNAKKHQTVRYELVHQKPETPILRRGESFNLRIRFSDDRTFDFEKDLLRLNFKFGPAPNPIKLTKGIIQVGDDSSFCKDKFEWDVYVEGTDANSVTLKVKIPCNAPVGIWKLEIMTADLRAPENVRLHDCREDIYILFNPWSHDDSVYMDETEKEEEHAGRLDEYILADVGKIWMGSYRKARGREWVFGQYDDAVLPICVYLLERSGLMHSQRNNPIAVSRALTKMVNSNDGNGVLVGRWDGKYSDGISPGTWTGSVKILEDYLRTKCAVKYGQCWIFAGVLTTLCRALGIPARPVSNFISGHDANTSITIDQYYDSSNEKLDNDPFNPRGGTDLIWNFHVWVEAWMYRPDLPLGYGGWQVIDATLQERPDGSSQCGPASVEAVKRGQVGFAYDVPSVLAKVDADVVLWQEDRRSSIGFTQIGTNQHHLGRQILTKKANHFDAYGLSDMEDITETYKPLERTKEKRIALENALQAVRKSMTDFEKCCSEDVIFDLVDLDLVPIGEGFNVCVKVQNTSDEVRTINAVLSATTNYYTGVKGRKVRHATGVIILQPNNSEEVNLHVKKEDYLEDLLEHGMMKVHAAASVTETNQFWVAEDDLQMIMPTLSVEVSETVPVGVPLEIEFTFDNSLELQLTDCKLNFEGPGLCRSDHKNCDDLAPGETMAVKITLTPKYTGRHKIVGVFHSAQFTDITGSAEITVTK